MEEFSVTCRCVGSGGKSSVLRVVVHVVLGRVQCYVSLCMYCWKEFSVTCRCAGSVGKSSVLRVVVQVVLGRVQYYVSLCM